MQIRPQDTADLDALVELTVETFRPFYTQAFPAMVGHDEDLVAHQHGDWDGDYRRDIPTFHRPGDGSHVAVAEEEGKIVGYVGWFVPAQRPDHGIIRILVVDAAARRHGVGAALMEHAMTALRRDGARFVELGTGGDDFHAPARGFSESLGFHPIPVTAYLRTL